MFVHLVELDYRFEYKLYIPFWRIWFDMYLFKPVMICNCRILLFTLFVWSIYHFDENSWKSNTLVPCISIIANQTQNSVYESIWDLSFYEFILEACSPLFSFLRLKVKEPSFVLAVISKLCVFFSVFFFRCSRCRFSSLFHLSLNYLLFLCALWRAVCGCVCPCNR